MVTKAERLQELKDQDQLYKVLDKYFDAGWKEFVKGIRQSNETSNFRIFKIVSDIKGNDFLKDLIRLMKAMKSKYAYLTLTKYPKGILLNTVKFENIPEMMIEKYPSGSYKEWAAYIQIKENRWVRFVF